MIRIASRRAKRILAAHLAETCPEHLGLLMQAGETFGDELAQQLRESL